MKITDEKPCMHMKRLLDLEAEGATPGWIRWYILAHVARCGPCKRVLLSLKAILAELKKAERPTPPEGMSGRLEGRAWRDALNDRPR